MFRALLIFRSSKVLIKLLRVLSISKLLILIANNIEKEKTISKIIIFFISFCFLLIIFIKSLMLISITLQIVELLLMSSSRITILFSNIFIINLYNDSNVKVLVSFESILCLRTTLMQMLRKRLFKYQDNLIYSFIQSILKSFKEIALN